jgi:hypothetical protein
MVLGYSTATQNAQLSSLAAQFDEGATGGTIKVYSGTRPANANTAPGGGNTLLLTFTLSATGFAAPVNGTMSAADLPLAAEGVAAGTAVWWRGADSSGNTVLDGSCGTEGSGEDIELSTTTISVGLDVSMTAGTFTQPA